MNKGQYTSIFPDKALKLSNAEVEIVLASDPEKGKDSILTYFKIQTNNPSRNALPASARKRQA